MEDYGFEYSDEEPEEQDVDIENQYYNSKGSFLFFFQMSKISECDFISEGYSIGRCFWGIILYMYV